MLRYIRALYPLLICCSVALFFPIGSAVAGKYWSVPSKIRGTIDSPLEVTFELYIKNKRNRRVLSTTDRTSFVVYDISKNKKLVSINEDRQMMAASLIKNFVMLAYFHEVKHGRQAHTNTNRGHLRAMIQVSSNLSTNYFIRLLGGPARVDRILRTNIRILNRPGLSNTYPRRTDLQEYDLRARSQHVLFAVMARTTPVFRENEVVFQTQNGDYIFKQTYIPSWVAVYNKTGTVYGLVGDGGKLVLRDPQGKSRPYVFVGLMEDRTKTSYRNRWQSFANWRNQRTFILRRLSERAYKYIYENHYGGRLVRR